MNTPLKIGIIGDYSEKKPSHTATDDALNHAAKAIGLAVECEWIPTESLDHKEELERVLKHYDGFWGAPGSPYRSETGALNGIRFARERLRPFIGT